MHTVDHRLQAAHISRIDVDTEGGCALQDAVILQLGCECAEVGRRHWRSAFDVQEYAETTVREKVRSARGPETCETVLEALGGNLAFVLASAHVALAGLKDQDGTKRVSAERGKLVGTQIGPATPAYVPSPGQRFLAGKKSEARDSLIDKFVKAVANESRLAAMAGIRCRKRREECRVPLEPVELGGVAQPPTRAAIAKHIA